MTEVSRKYEERIVILAERLSKRFGDAAPDVIERQIEDAQGDAHATWSAIRHYLSTARDRRL